MDRDEAEVGTAFDDNRAGLDRLGEESDEGLLPPVLAQLTDVVEVRQVGAPELDAVHIEQEVLERARHDRRNTIDHSPETEPAGEPGKPFERPQGRELCLHGSPATLPDTLVPAYERLDLDHG